MTGSRGLDCRGMAAAVAWSGGKDSGLALLRAREAGVRVTHLFTLHEAWPARVRFHGVPIEWVRAQGDALGLPVRFQPYDVAAGDFEAAFHHVLDRLKREQVECLIFGNVHLEDVRAWYEDRTVAAGFRHLEPLWQEDPKALVEEFLERGGRTRIVSVSDTHGDATWVGRELTATLLKRIAASDRYDPCGEFGEYHTFMFDGPGFRAPLAPRFGASVEQDGHTMVTFDSEP